MLPKAECLGITFCLLYILRIESVCIREHLINQEAASPCFVLPCRHCEGVREVRWGAGGQERPAWLSKFLCVLANWLWPLHPICLRCASCGGNAPYSMGGEPSHTSRFSRQVSSIHATSGHALWLAAAVAPHASVARLLL